MQLRGKVVLITGATGGIGIAAVRAFDKEGSHVVIASRRKEILDALSSEIKSVLVLPVDLSDEIQAVDMIDKTMDHFGRIDILINIAASIIVVPAEQVGSSDLLTAYKTNLCGPVAATQRAIRHMKSKGGLHIINVGSPGFMMGIPFYSPYVCSKAAFSAWTRTIQAEWEQTNIIVSEYFPGYIMTNSRPESRIGEVDQNFLMDKKQNFISRHFTKPQKPEDVAKHLVKLALKPKPLMCSSFSVRIGTFISNFPAFRLSIASQMAKTARSRIPGLNLGDNPRL